MVSPHADTRTGSSGGHHASIRAELAQRDSETLTRWLCTSPGLVGRMGAPGSGRLWGPFRAGNREYLSCLTRTVLPVQF
jgi:hypothetical protein